MPMLAKLPSFCSVAANAPISRPTTMMPSGEAKKSLAFFTPGPPFCMYEPWFGGESAGAAHQRTVDAGYRGGEF